MRAERRSHACSSGGLLDDVLADPTVQLDELSHRGDALDALSGIERSGHRGVELLTASPDRPDSRSTSAASGDLRLVDDHEPLEAPPSSHNGSDARGFGDLKQTILRELGRPGSAE